MVGQNTTLGLELDNFQPAFSFQLDWSARTVSSSGDTWVGITGASVLMALARLGVDLKRSLEPVQISP